MKDFIILKNPHSILAVLKNRPEDVYEVVLSGPKSWMKYQEGKVWIWSEILKLIELHEVSVIDQFSTNDKKGREVDHRQSFIEVRIKNKQSVSLKELLSSKETSSSEDRPSSSPVTQKYGLWLALDQIQDPQNLGSIFRSAAFFGVTGIVMTKDHSAHLTSIVYDVASGGVESVPYHIHSNLQQVFQLAKDSGLWVLGTSEHAVQSYREVPRDRNWMLVLGSEGMGMRRLTHEACDLICSIPSTSPVSSLNVSVACGVLIQHFC